MPPRKRAKPITQAETTDWLFKAVGNAPRPLPAGRFPQILQQAQWQGHSRENLLNTLDEWLNFGYCVLTDAIAQDMELTGEGERFFYK